MVATKIVEGQGASAIATNNMKKAKKFNPVRNPALEAAVKGFVPVFGNHEDLDIVMRISNLNAELEIVDCNVLRYGNPKDFTKKMKDILFKERSLISAITRRNMDF